MITAVQQFMLGSVISNEKEAREALGRISNSGYTGIELCSFMTNKTPLAVRLLTRMAGMPCGGGGGLDWGALTKEFSLSVVSLHTDLGSLERDIDACVAEAKGYGTRYLVVTGMYRFDHSSSAAALDLAERLNKVGRELRERGMLLLYHNHNAELTFTDNGKREYEIIIENTDADLVGFEFDSYWFAEGGADPAYWMQRLADRLRLWHISDRGARMSGASMTPILKTAPVELGRGNMPLATLAQIAASVGCEAAVLEMHNNWVNKSPLDSLALSAEWLKKNIH